MKTTYVSTVAVAEANRRSIQSLQKQLAQSQLEVSSGRHADVGVALGQNTGRAVSLRGSFERLTVIQETNAVVETRLDVTDEALGGFIKNSNNFTTQLIAARDTNGSKSVLQTTAKALLGSLQDGLNSSVAGSYIFAGINADQKPISDYFSNPPSAAKTATTAAFTTAFGFPPSDPAAQGISGAAMQTFLDGAYANLFAPAQWDANWSTASDTNMQSRISTTEVVETSSNANISGARKFASALVMIADLGVEALNADAFRAVIDSAIKLAGATVADLSAEQSKLGVSQERLLKANERMTVQKDIFNTQRALLEEIDGFEASTRVTSLLTQIETAYSLTVRVQNLSILNFL